MKKLYMICAGALMSLSSCVIEVQKTTSDQESEVEVLTQDELLTPTDTLYTKAGDTFIFPKGDMQWEKDYDISTYYDFDDSLVQIFHHASMVKLNNQSVYKVSFGATDGDFIIGKTDGKAEIEIEDATEPFTIRITKDAKSLEKAEGFENLEPHLDHNFN